VNFRFDFGGRRGFGSDFRSFNRRGLFYRSLGAFDHAHATLHGRLFLGEVLIANLLRQLLRNRVGRHAHVYTFAPHFFNQALGIELEFFSEIVNSDLRGNGHALLFRRRGNPSVRLLSSGLKNFARNHLKRASEAQRVRVAEERVTQTAGPTGD